MGVSQKEWNHKARAAARKAATKARKEKRSAYSKAYLKVWHKSPAGKLSAKRSDKGRQRSSAYKLQQKRWHQSPTGKLTFQRSESRRNLRKALRIKGPLLNGWPDAGRIEQKLGRDSVRSEQWRRAAQAHTKGIVFSLLFAATHEDAMYTKKYKIISFEEYAKQLGMLKEWNKLVRKVKNF
jgi:hypothetical protein